MPENPPQDPLSRLLRAGDPAAGDPGLDPRQRASMRQRILAAGREGRRSATGWLLPAATAMALLALALGLALRQPKAPIPAPLAEARQTTLTTPVTGQQIQFTTDGGTLVVWVLQPRSTS